MKNSTFYLLLLVQVLITGCGKDPDVINRFSEDITYNLKAEKIEINEILEPGYSVKTDDYLIFFGESGKNRDLFYVYSLDNLEFLYSFGTNGNARNEFLLTCPAYYPLAGNKFYVTDPYKRNLFVYELNDNKETLVDIHNLEIPITQPLGIVSMLNDSILLFNLVNAEDSFLSSYNLKKSEVIDTVTFDLHLRSLLGNDYNPTINSFSLGDLTGRDVFVAHTYIDEITKLRLNDDYTFETNSVELHNDTKKPYSGNSMSDALMYYGFLRHQSDYVAATRVCKGGLSMHPMNPLVSYDFDLEIYDTNLNPVALLKFDQNFLRFELDLERGYIYSWDVLKGFDAIHRYDIRDILKPNIN